MRLLLLVLLSLPAAAFAQVTLSRQVITPLALNGEGSVSLTSTAGQVETATFIGDTLTLTQGFQQPDFEDLTIGITLEWPPCDNGEGATLTIADIGGCGNNNAQIFWDGVLIDGNVIANITPGFYPLEIQSGVGCNLSFDFPIAAPNDLPACDLVFYNTLTPNGDGDNDVWWIDNIAALGGTDTQVQIFNRWGNPVWEGKGYDNENVVFDGTHTNGNALPDGTYYYVVDVDELQFTGYIELVR